MKYNAFLSKLTLFLSILGGSTHLIAEDSHSPSNISIAHSANSLAQCREDFRHCKNNSRGFRDAWLITGNKHINANRNFLGTFNGTPINISANGAPGTRPYIRVTALGQIEIFNTRHGVFIGEGAGASNLGEHNTFIGYHSGFNTTIEPTFQQPGDNTALGYNSFFSNTIGEDNTAIGSSALFSAVQASQNTAVGFQALFASVDGAFNTAVGASALNAGTTGSFNTAIGFSALHNNANNFNTAVGFQSLGGNASGQLNTALGTNALLNNISGSMNTAIGINALLGNSTGSRNTILGANADVAIFGGPLTNATAIGYAAVCDSSNKVRIGNMDVEVIEGEVPFTTPSDGRFKTNVENNVPGLSFVLKLRPVTYQIDTNQMATLMQIPEEKRSIKAKTAKSKSVKSGFIAQEVEIAAQNIGYDFDGLNAPESEDKGYYGLAYSSFVVTLVKAVQEQQALIIELQQKVNQLTEIVQQEQK